MISNYFLRCLVMKKKSHHLELKVKHPKQNKIKMNVQPSSRQDQLLSADVFEQKLAVLEARQQQKARYYMNRINELTSIIAKQGNTRSLLTQELNDLGRQMQEQQHYLLKVKHQYLEKSLQASLAQSEIIQSQYFGITSTNPEVLFQTRQNIVKMKKKGKRQGLYRSLQHYRSQMSLSGRNEEKEFFKRRLGLVKITKKDR